MRPGIRITSLPLPSTVTVIRFDVKAVLAEAAAGSIMVTSIASVVAIRLRRFIVAFPICCPVFQISPPLEVCHRRRLR